MRGPVTKFIEVPEEHSAAHDLVTMYRNRTVAHSQSDLLVTYAVGVLDARLS